MTEIWFESHGTQLYAVERGRGRPILLLHGGLATHLACWRFAEPLAEHARVITPDLRASGRSVWAGELTWDALADDVAALARHLGLERVAVGGISFGAGVAVRVALRHPLLVDALALLHPAYAGADVGLAPAQRDAMRAMHAAGSRVEREGIGALLPLFDALPPDLRERARAVAATYDPASVAASTRFMDSGVQPFATSAELAAIAAPAIVVPGVDPYHPAEHAGVFRAIPRCTVVDTPDLAGALAGLLGGSALSG